MGYAGGGGCNRLIDTLRQKIPGICCNVAAVRTALQMRFQNLLERDFLELDVHWRDVIELLGEYNEAEKRRPLDSSRFQILCLDVMNIGSGDVVGTGEIVLRIAR